MANFSQTTVYLLHPLGEQGNPQAMFQSLHYIYHLFALLTSHSAYRRNIFQSGINNDIIAFICIWEQFHGSCNLTNSVLDLNF